MAWKGNLSLLLPLQHLLSSGLTTSTTIFTTTVPTSTTLADGRTVSTNVVVTKTFATVFPVSTDGPFFGPTAGILSSSHSLPNPGIIVGASIGAGILILGGLFVILRRRKISLRAKISGFRTKIGGPKSGEEVGRGEIFQSPSDSGVNHITPYPLPDHALTYRTDTFYTPGEKRISISMESLENPFHSHADLNRASWEAYIGRFSSSDANTISTRQLYISNQVNRVREKVVELEEMLALLRSTSQSSRIEGPALPDQDSRLSMEVAEPFNDSDPNGFESQDRDMLQRAIHQIDVLNTRINELERQRRSSWALGRSDESPPGYTEQE
ncbi:hypothetical protein B0H17DRAFT_1143317 [Mycena rosella]|uniref:Uncharacterized protein n=1 Tax=Mycena rosella TaxID=1033263 RepID=A0AAD7CV82_MYCRO|nr:hypothetical protein B0H17DRAFT_1143317 [Mycena rosella]